MTEINNTSELQAAIRQLQTDMQERDHVIKQKISTIEESLHPANILLAAFNKITGSGHSNFENRQSFSGSILRGGFKFWLYKLLLKTEQKVEQNVYDSIDSAFDHLKDFMKRKL